MRLGSIAREFSCVRIKDSTSSSGPCLLFGLATGRRRDAAVKYQRLSGVTQRFSRKQPYNCISDHVRDRPRHAVAAGYSTLMGEILNDNARPEAGEVCGAMDMGWAKLVGQIAHAYGK